MKNLKIILSILVISSCASTNYSSYSDYKSNALLPGNASFARDSTNSFYYFWTSRDDFICSNKETLDEALICSIEKCEKFYSTLRSKDMKMAVQNPIPYQCVAVNISDDKDTKASPDILEWDTFNQSPIKKEIVFLNTYHLREAERIDAIRYKNFEAKVKKLRTEREIEERELAIKNEKDLLMEQLIAFIDDKKNLCKIYGFKDDRDIATCVQKEVNAEINRMQSQQALSKQVIQVQPNNNNRYQALSNMGACLQTEGSFGACANAWQGYTPKKVVKCSFDAFGNKITSTCREQ